MIEVDLFRGQEVAVFGLGMSGLASVRALIAGGAKVCAWDDREAPRTEAEERGAAIADFRSLDWSRFAALVLAPGVPLTHPDPHWTVRLAEAAGVPVIGDTELFCRAQARHGAGSRTVAITGTNGKSTTTALIAHVLKAHGRAAFAGGNIGTAVLDLPAFAAGQIYVLEFSSYQIDLTPHLSPDVAVLLNITPDHLDRHGTMDNYAAVKARIFARLRPEADAVVSVDDPYVRPIHDSLAGRSRLWAISVGARVEDGAFVEDGVLYEVHQGRARAVGDLGALDSLRGAHNWQNAAAAFAACRGLDLEAEDILPGLASFPGLEHRMEVLGSLGRVLFVNDSKATNAEAAEKALEAFTDVYWIAGGLAKEGGIESLRPLFKRMRRAYLVGDAAGAFEGVLRPEVDCAVCGTIERAVAEAAQDARRSDAPEPVVLLSPACASFDQFPSFAARGDRFRQCVAELPGISLRNKEGPA